MRWLAVWVYIFNLWLLTQIFQYIDSRCYGAPSPPTRSQPKYLDPAVASFTVVVRLTFTMPARITIAGAG